MIFLFVLVLVVSCERWGVVIGSGSLVLVRGSLVLVIELKTVDEFQDLVVNVLSLRCRR